MQYIDLRSDTVTQPTDAMRAAMAAAPVGDDVYGDDPTVLALEALAAEKTGKQRALFVPSGTMGNQIAILTHTRRGDDVLCLRRGHIFQHEVGAASLISGVTLNLMDPLDGIPHVDDVAKNIRQEDIHCPPTTLLCTENALATGHVVPLADARALYDDAKARALMVHMDGARIFNAAAALCISAAEIASTADSVMFCLSKGLCAPVGSMLCGDAEFIARARKNRKLLGGGLRQAGILAAAGILAIEDMAARLSEDHDNATYLAAQLEAMPQVNVNRPGISINMVFFTLDMPDAFLQALPARMLAHGVKMNPLDLGEFRFVTHHGVNAADIDAVVCALRGEIEKA